MPCRRRAAGPRRRDSAGAWPRAVVRIIPPLGRPRQPSPSGVGLATLRTWASSWPSFTELLTPSPRATSARNSSVSSCVPGVLGRRPTRTLGRSRRAPVHEEEGHLGRGRGLHRYQGRPCFAATPSKCWSVHPSQLGDHIPPLLRYSKGRHRPLRRSRPRRFGCFQLGVRGQRMLMRSRSALRPSRCRPWECCGRRPGVK